MYFTFLKTQHIGLELIQDTISGVFSQVKASYFFSSSLFH